jgi:hypothetical protein
MRAGHRACVAESLEERRLFVTEVGVTPLVDTVRFTDSDGTVSTISVRGGTGNLRFIADLVPMQKGRTVTLPAATDLQSITLAPSQPGGTIQSISIRAKGGDGFMNLPQTTINGSLGLFGAKSARLGGTLTIQGACGRFLLGEAADGSSVTFAGGVQQVSVSGDCFADLTINGNRAIDSVTRIVIRSSVRGMWDVDVPVGSVFAGDFEDDWEGDFDDLGSLRSGGDFRGSVSGLSIVGIYARGDFTGSVSANSMRGMYVGGDMTNTNLGFLGEPEDEDDYALEYLTVKGVIDGCVFSSIGSLGDVKAACIKGSIFFAGINAEGLSANNRIPSTPQNFERNTEVRSIKISARSALGFSDNVIAAKVLGKLNLGRVFTLNGGQEFGFGTTMVESASGTLFGSGQDMRFRFTRLGSNADVANQSSAQRLEKGDFRVRLTL